MCVRVFTHVTVASFSLVAADTRIVTLDAGAESATDNELL